MNDLLFYLPAALAFAAVAFGTLALAFLVEGLRAAARRRAILKRLEPAKREDADMPELFRPDESQGMGVLGMIPRFRDAPLLLRQAGISWSPYTFLVLVVGLAFAFGIATFMVTASPVLALVAAFFGGMLPDLKVRRSKKKRLRQFEEQFPEAIDLLSRAIRAGHPLSAGIRMVAEETRDPIAGEFNQVFEENRFGLPFDDALMGLADRNELMDVRIFATAVLIQREVGGNLAEILDKIAQTVRARFSIQRQLRVYTAQGRMSGYVLGVMPVALALGIFAIDPTYASMLWEEPLGRMMVAAALTLQIIGYLWIRKIVNIEI